MKNFGMQIGDDFDLVVENGATSMGDTVPQNQALIIVSNPGEWKQFPALGVGIESWVNDDNPGSLAYEVKRQLKSDGFTVESVNLENGQLSISAEY
jgi:hypothetical protein